MSISVSVTRASITVTGPAIVTATIAIVAAISITVVIPRACANEDAAVEPCRTVVAVRGTRIRVVAVVAIRANRGITVVSSAIHRAANPNAHRNLSMGVSRRGEQQNTENSEIA
jgi:hypothetical protein